MLFFLRCQHIIVPTLQLASFFSNINGMYSMEKFMDVTGMFFAQSTMFYTVFHQLHNKSVLLQGYNLWFTIEILTFYGYMVGSIIYIFERAIRSNFGLLSKASVKDCYKFDFMLYHNKPMYWTAFIFILWFNNFMIC